MKICFVIPRYSNQTSDHFSHLYQFIEKIAAQHQVVLIAEMGDPVCQIQGLAAYYPNALVHPVLRVFQAHYQ